MSKLDELINELCPNGVAYRPLGEVCNLSAGGDVPKDRYSKEKTKKYSIPIYSNGIGDNALYGYTDLAKIEKRCVTIAARGTIGYPALRKEPFYPIIRLICAIPKENIIADFLYYVIEPITFQVPTSGIPQLTLPMVSKYMIPLPPLPVQEEIVRILDSFTELTAELTAELMAEHTARKKQYKYYRDRLLENNNYPCKQLGELCKFIRGPFGGSLKKECFQEKGFAVYEQQHAIYSKFEFRYYVSEDKFDELQRFEVFPNDLIMSCSGTMGKIAIIPSNAPRGIINQALLKLTANDDVDVKYLKYCFESTIAKQMNDNARGGAIKNVASVDVLKKIKVKLPPLLEQQRIVDILDRFDTLCNDISNGLPAEIEARKKQYKYYRDKLLTFPKAEDGIIAEIEV